MSTLSRCRDANKTLNCFITLLPDSARKQAEASDERARSKSLIGPLDGVPVAVKDIFYIQGVRCTAGSKILADSVAPYDSPVVRRLRSAGAVIIGTTNLHEFAAGVTSENPHYGSVLNPWDRSRMAGGSSGGSAAAVAAGLVPLAIGTDTAGSVRIPAALCGVVGFKPTYGLISRLGVLPLAPSFDTVGTLTSTTADAAALLQVLAGHDPEDLTTTSAEIPEYDLSAKGAGRNISVGVPQTYFHDNIDPAVEKAFEGFLEDLRSVGFTVRQIELDGIDEVYDSWVAIRRAEATAFHLRWLETVPELYGEDVRRLLELGKSVPATDYVNAQNARPVIIQRFINSMKGVDLLAVPTTSVTAPTLGSKMVTINRSEVEVYSALNRLTLPFNYVGFPTATLPARTDGGLPVGVQLVARPFEELALLGAMAAYEALRGQYPSPGPELSD